MFVILPSAVSSLTGAATPEDDAAAVIEVTTTPASTAPSADSTFGHPLSELDPAIRRELLSKTGAIPGASRLYSGFIRSDE